MPVPQMPRLDVSLRSLFFISHFLTNVLSLYSYAYTLTDIHDSYAFRPANENFPPSENDVDFQEYQPTLSELEMMSGNRLEWFLRGMETFDTPIFNHQPQNQRQHSGGEIYQQRYVLNPEVRMPSVEPSISVSDHIMNQGLSNPIESESSLTEGQGVVPDMPNAFEQLLLESNAVLEGETAISNQYQFQQPQSQRKVFSYLASKRNGGRDNEVSLMMRSQRQQQSSPRSR